MAAGEIARMGVVGAALFVSAAVGFTNTAQAQGVPQQTQQVPTNTAKATYYIQNLNINYNDNAGDADVDVVAVGDPNNSVTRATIVHMHFKTNRSGATDSRKNNNALFIDELTANSAVPNNSAVIPANARFSVKASGFSAPGYKGYNIQKAPDILNPQGGQPVGVEELEFVGQGVSTVFTINGRGQANPSFGMKQLKNDARTYGLLLGQFQSSAVEQRDLQGQSATSLVPTRITTATPGQGF